MLWDPLGYLSSMLWYLKIMGSSWLLDPIGCGISRLQKLKVTGPLRCGSLDYGTSRLRLSRFCGILLPQLFSTAKTYKPKVKEIKTHLSQITSKDLDKLMKDRK